MIYVVNDSVAYRVATSFVQASAAFTRLERVKTECFVVSIITLLSPSFWFFLEMLKKKIKENIFKNLNFNDKNKLNSIEIDIFNIKIYFLVKVLK